MNTAGIVFLSLGTLFMLIPIIIALATQEYHIIMFSLLSLIWFTLFPEVNYPEPTNNDVKNGKAVYIEEVNVVLDENGDTLKFMPTNTFVMFPDGELGKTWFGTTPAESDLMSSAVANVSITDTGVAVTTVTKADPVQVETIVSMICLPSFEQAGQVYILDTEV